jgi:hypothetical protein
MIEIKKLLIIVINSHCEEIEKLIETVTDNIVDSFYIGDIIKLFHKALSEFQITLKDSNKFGILQDFEPYCLLLELIHYNRIKVPLKKKFEDTKNILEKYLHDLKKISSQID